MDTSAVYARLTSTDAWYTRSVSPSFLDTPVLSVRFIGHLSPQNAGGDLGEAPTNHWTMSLITSQEDSVNLDILPPDINKPAVIMLTAINKESTWKPENDSVRIVSADTIAEGGTTIGGILGLIMSLNRDKYQYHESGEGCRFWMKTVAGDLAAAGVISADRAEEVAADIGYYWPDPVTDMQRVLRPISAGTFLAG
ncbi:hypothetical protein PENSPDRAFT_590088 [Peniophora sp. CONT]|nr:hypothetical protein PENSPDRAFT_590088 [Peniophora sp. CONT]